MQNTEDCTHIKKTLAIIALCVCVLIFGCMGAATLSQGTRSFQGQAHESEWPSTPRDEWTQGAVPALYQKDSEWSAHPYADGTFGETGCGPLCLSMVYIFLTGDTGFSPTNLADYAMREGYAGASGTEWSFMRDGARHLGIYAQEIGLQEALMKDCLAYGSPIICAMGPGDFTSEGHFIVLSGVDGQGNFIVRDPNSVERTATTWSYETISSQCQNLWVFSL